MFRLFLNIIISLLLLISTNGIVLSKHYCEGALPNVTFYITDTCCDSTCGSCKSENIIIQIEEEFYIEKFEFVFSNFFVELISGIGHYIESADFNKLLISINLLEPFSDSLDVLLSKYQAYLC